jgi:hypothetical protein
VYLTCTGGAAQLRLPSCTAQAQSPIDATSFGGHLLQGEEQKTLNSTRLKLDVRCRLGQVSSLFFQLLPRRPLLHPQGRPQYPSSPCHSFSRCRLHRVFFPPQQHPLLWQSPSACSTWQPEAIAIASASASARLGAALRALLALLTATTQLLRTYFLCAVTFDFPGAPGLPATLRRMFLLPLAAAEPSQTPPRPSASARRW